MKQLVGSKLGKGYNKAVYCLPAYLNFVCRILQIVIATMKLKDAYSLEGRL